MTTQSSTTRTAGKKVKAVFKEMLGQQTPSAIQDQAPPLHPDGLREEIAARAYALFVERGYRAGCDLQDWLDAEREILSRQRPA